MQMEWWRDPGTLDRRISILISERELEEVYRTLNDLDKLLLRECDGPDATLADRLLGLELLARRLQEKKDRDAALLGRAIARWGDLASLYKLEIIDAQEETIVVKLKGDYDGHHFQRAVSTIALRQIIDPNIIFEECHDTLQGKAASYRLGQAERYSGC